MISKASLRLLMAAPFTAKRPWLSQTRLFSYVPSRRPLSYTVSRLPFRCQNYAPKIRYNSSLSVPASEATSTSSKAPVPAYLLTFTCKPCGHRSTHQVTKQGYHHGTVLITCPSCKNRHVIADHLKVFMDQKSTLEDILQRNAGPGGDLSKLLKRGKLGIRQDSMVGNEGEEDVEFWEDGTESVHESVKQ